MNMLHVRYAVEVAATGSINKAAENLLIAQPNLSRSIKALESDLGIAIFQRSAKGMELTPEGMEFIGYARKLLSEIEELESHYRTGAPMKKRFTISVPRSCYVAEAFSHFSRSIGDEPVEIFYKETNSSRAVKNIMESNYKLGIIRYAEKYDEQFRRMLDEKDLAYEVVTKFHYVLLMSEKSPLCQLDEIRFDDLSPYIEIAHGDPYVPSMSTAQVRREEIPDNIDKRIFVFERSAQFDVLSANYKTFMWVSPVPDRFLEGYHLVQRKSPDNQKMYQDVLIYPKNYRLSDLDLRFISELEKVKNQYNCFR